jgi:hypothetical protein
MYGRAGFDLLRKRMLLAAWLRANAEEPWKRGKINWDANPVYQFLSLGSLRMATFR